MDIIYLISCLAITTIGLSIVAKYRDYLLETVKNDTVRNKIIQLKWENINLKNHTATFLDSKNGDDRTIPLSTKAVAIFQNIIRNINSKFF
jgi:integrase